jgi:hypothetical protein
MDCAAAQDGHVDVCVELRGATGKGKVSIVWADPADPFSMLLAQSYLCAALVGSGEIDAARVYFRTTERFLVAGREEELLEACRAAAAP